MKTINWNNQEWLPQQFWGNAHPDHICWQDPSCISVKNNVLTLDVKYDPKIVIIDDEPQDRVYGVGYMTSVTDYKYGEFYFEYELPLGVNLWPAIWLSSTISWPPEIDIMEGWTGQGLSAWKNRSDYLRFIGFNNIHPGVFTGTSNKPIGHGYGSFGSDRATYSWYQPTNKKCSCKLIWTPNHIKVEYNGHQIMDITDKSILREFDKPMRVHINTYITNKFTDKNYKDYRINGRPFKVYKFTYKPLS